MKVREVESADKGVCGEDVPNLTGDYAIELKNAWRKEENIRVSELQLGDFIAEDGVTVKLHEQNKKR
ncbi:hypothetical protein MA16_Dca025172 [Dendrobium catenatum]|uniref:Uncharacterized protein n=1 Tax=Dendrobium catenatum TaxID=906689 RepID=A0A2I0VID5_9ASPA|nr:hypothetical protein MA16_Dca025172 [Dendrobium catenatum]